MSTEVKRRGGTTAQHTTFTGAAKELTVDTTKNTVVVHDGTTAGGHPLATEAYTDTKIEEAFGSVTAADIPTSDESDVQTKLTTYAETLGNHTTTIGEHTSQLADITNRNNLYSSAALITGKYISATNGAEVTNAAFGYFSLTVEAGEYYFFKNNMSATTQYGAYFDSNDDFVSAIAFPSIAMNTAKTLYLMCVPAGAVTAKINVILAESGSVVVSRNAMDIVHAGLFADNLAKKYVAYQDAADIYDVAEDFRSFAIDGIYNSGGAFVLNAALSVIPPFPVSPGEKWKVTNWLGTNQYTALSSRGIWLDSSYKRLLNVNAVASNEPEVHGSENAAYVMLNIVSADVENVNIKRIYNPNVLQTLLPDGSITEPAIDPALLSGLRGRDIAYVSTLTNADNIDGTTPIAHGAYALGIGASVPQGTFPEGYNTGVIGLFVSINIANYFFQYLTQYYSGHKVWIRLHSSGKSPLAWQETTNNFFKKTLGASDNIDDLAEGSYIINTTTTSGTYPAGLGTYAVLVVQGSGNFKSQMLSDANGQSYATRAWIRTKGSTWGTWVEITNKAVPEPVDPAQPLYGKHDVWMGDSIIKGSGGSDNIPQQVGVRTGATTTNIAVGGTQMANHLDVPDYNPFSFCNLATAFATNTWTTQDAVAATIGYTETLATMKALDLSTVNYLHVGYGHNDRSNGVVIGDAESTDNDEFCGALNNGISTLLTAFPNLSIILITPYDRVSAPGTMAPYAAAIRAKAQSMSLPLIDLFYISGVNSLTAGELLSDGLHIAVGKYELFGSKVAGNFGSDLSSQLNHVEK